MGSEVTVDRGKLEALQRDWRIPPELEAASLPRRIGMTNHARARLVVFVILLVAALVAGGLFVLPAIRDRPLLAREGTAATATVTRLDTEMELSWWLLVIPGGILAMAAMPFGFIARQGKLLAWGMVAGGVVTSVRCVRHATSGSSLQIGYSFLDAGGDMTSGFGLIPGEAPVVGQLVTVLYDPSRPARNLPYPMRFARVVEGEPPSPT